MYNNKYTQRLLYGNSKTIGITAAEERSRGRAARQIWDQFSSRSRRWAGGRSLSWVFPRPSKQATPRAARAAWEEEGRGAAGVQHGRLSVAG